MNAYKSRFNSEKQNLIEEVRLYTNNELDKQAKYYDEINKYPVELVKWFFEKDIFSLLTTESTNDLAVFLEIIRIVSTKFASLGSILLTQAFYGCTPLYHFGTKDQKNTYLDKLLSGEKMGAFALSEDTDGPYIQTKAWETTEGWELNGSKQYVSNAQVADFFLVVASTHSLKGKEGTGIFIVEASNPGLNISEPMDKMGIRALPVSSLTLERVTVFENALLGEETTGEQQIEFIMNLMKLAVSMQAVGIAQGAFDKGLDYLNIVRKFGSRLMDNQNTQQKMAELKTDIYSAEAFVRQILLNNPQHHIEVAMAKLLTANIAVKTTETIIQLTGGHGYMKDSEIERYIRDAKVTAIYGGSSDSQKKIIAKPWINKN